MQKQRKEQGEHTRKLIIDVTTKLFATRGYAGTSLDLIAKEAQTSKSSIFWHFENKEDLLFTVVDQAMGEWEVNAGTQTSTFEVWAEELQPWIDRFVR